jgi:hypothetical protein
MLDASTGAASAAVVSASEWVTIPHFGMQGSIRDQALPRYWMDGNWRGGADDGGPVFQKGDDVELPY